jgi:hypothetical protein
MGLIQPGWQVNGNLYQSCRLEYGKAFFSFRDHSYRNLIISLSFHHMMVQDELMLVFQNAHFDAQLNRHTCFAFADPLGMWFKNGEYSKAQIN